MERAKEIPCHRFISAQAASDCAGRCGLLCADEAALERDPSDLLQRRPARLFETAREAARGGGDEVGKRDTRRRRSARAAAGRVLAAVHRAMGGADGAEKGGSSSDRKISNL